MTRKNILSLLLLGLMVAGIPLATYLVRQQQLLRSQASVDPIKFTGDNVTLLAGDKVGATDKIVQVEVTSPFESVTPPRSRNPEASIVRVSSNTPGAGDTVTITYTVNGDVNFVNLWADGCERWNADGTCNFQSGAVGLVQQRITSPGEKTIRWDASHITHTPGIHNVGIHAYYCENDDPNGVCHGPSGSTVDYEEIRVGDGGSSTTTPTPIPSGRIDISSRNPTINVYWISDAPITNPNSPPPNKISNPVFSANQDVYFYFNKNNDVTDVNLRVDGEELGAASAQVSFPIDQPCPAAGCFIKWPASYRHTQSDHEVNIKPYVCPDATRNGCKAGSQPTFTVKINSNSGFLLEDLWNRLFNIETAQAQAPQCAIGNCFGYGTGGESNVCCTNGLYCNCNSDQQCAPTCGAPGTPPAEPDRTLRCGAGFVPNAAGTDCVTPTPVSDSNRQCGASCDENRACATGYTCWGGECRSPSAPNDPTCPGISTGGNPSSSAPVAQVTLTPLRTQTQAPAGTTTTGFKISETNSDAAWSVATLHQYTAGETNLADYEFISSCSAGTPNCDPYPRGNRRVFVQFIGQKLNNGGEYKEVWSSDIILALKPVITSALCSVPGTGTGTTITVKGQHFGDEAGSVTFGGQSTTLPAGSWTNPQIVANSTQSISGTQNVIVTTVDNIASDPVPCGTGESLLDVKASLACRSADKPLSTADIEIREDTPQGKVVDKKDKVPFDADGKPQYTPPALIEGKAYKLIIKAPNALTKVVKFTAAAGTTALEALNLPVGDIVPDNGDCQINQLDRSRLVSEWTAAKSSGKRSDLNGDTFTNSFDYSCMMSNFRKECDRP